MKAHWNLPVDSVSWFVLEPILYFFPFFFSFFFQGALQFSTSTKFYCNCYQGFISWYFHSIWRQQPKGKIIQGSCRGWHEIAFHLQGAGWDIRKRRRGRKSKQVEKRWRKVALGSGGRSCPAQWADCLQVSSSDECRSSRQDLWAPNCWIFLHFSYSLISHSNASNWLFIQTSSEMCFDFSVCLKKHSRAAYSPAAGAFLHPPSSLHPLSISHSLFSPLSLPLGITSLTTSLHEPAVQWLSRAGSAACCCKALMSIASSCWHQQGWWQKADVHWAGGMGWFALPLLTLWCGVLSSPCTVAAGCPPTGRRFCSVRVGGQWPAFKACWNGCGWESVCKHRRDSQKDIIACVKNWATTKEKNKWMREGW